MTASPKTWRDEAADQDGPGIVGRQEADRAPLPVPVLVDEGDAVEAGQVVEVAHVPHRRRRPVEVVLAGDAVKEVDVGGAAA